MESGAGEMVVSSSIAVLAFRLYRKKHAGADMRLVYRHGGEEPDAGMGADGMCAAWPDGFCDTADILMAELF